MLQLVLWIGLRQKKAILPAIMVLVSLLYIDRYIGPNTAAPPIDPDSFTIATYNMSNALSGYDREADKRQTKRDRLEKYLHLLRPADIICVQEKGLFATYVIHSVFNKNELYSHENKGAAILTRYKIKDKGFIEFGTTTNSCLRADLLIDGQVVRIYSVHLQSNQITRDAKQVIENPDLQEEKVWQGIRKILAKFTTSHHKPIQQSRLIAQHIAECPHPLVLCGDFNNTPLSHTYEVLTEDLADSFVARGRGLASTFADGIPMLRIDYVLASPALEVLSHQVKPAPYSDHYPVVVDLRLRE